VPDMNGLSFDRQAVRVAARLSGARRRLNGCPEPTRRAALRLQTDCYGKIPRLLYAVSSRVSATMYAAVRVSTL
jgi:hypothetical protein